LLLLALVVVDPAMVAEVVVEDLEPVHLLFLQHLMQLLLVMVEAVL
jgi:hypothetical protein